MGLTILSDKSEIKKLHRVGSLCIQNQQTLGVQFRVPEKRCRHLRNCYPSRNLFAL